MAYFALFTKETDGRFSVSVPALPGCLSQGNTFEEAKKNIEEATELYLENEDEEEEENLKINIQFLAPIEIKKK